MSGIPFTSGCTICGSHTHGSRKCNELWADTDEGFYTGGGSNRDYGDGEEEDKNESKVLTNLSVDGYSFCRYDGWPW